ncbi:DUF3667 domain-containing protein [Wenzhouxiangella sp. XN24]|uniref:DUF3667 domain-containing protein n=1 Tax=Wenzhouxiangella sp. XN24 TaxID=2713569 RepID=UPI0013EC8E96|nr:DUF3667 domain-containing protein [Wenzhouxiangella sp. XN24]NGX14789.1 DUF3667 domain-containing protein [Wenzhouxiangella sp. XN24]
MTDSCPNCDAILQGRYCHACGQRRIEPEERRLSWFFSQLVEAFTMADRRFLGSIARLMFKPGSLDRDWLEGRRRRNLAPLSLFLIANLVYFFYPPLTDFNLSLADQAAHQPYSAIVERLVSARLEARGLDFEVYALQYQAKANDIAKLLVILHAPLLALVLLALHARRYPYFVEHLMVSLHFWAFTLFMIMFLPWVLAVLVSVAGMGSQGFLQLALLAVVGCYAWRQMTVAYVQPGWLALAKLPLFLLGLVLAHFTYRAAQFLLAFLLS